MATVKETPKNISTHLKSLLQNETKWLERYCALSVFSSTPVIQCYTSTKLGGSQKTDRNKNGPTFPIMHDKVLLIQWSHAEKHKEIRPFNWYFHTFCNRNQKLHLPGKKLEKSLPSQQVLFHSILQLIGQALAQPFGSTIGLKANILLPRFKDK